MYSANPASKSIVFEEWWNGNCGGDGHVFLFDVRGGKVVARYFVCGCEQEGQDPASYRAKLKTLPKRSLGIVTYQSGARAKVSRTYWES